MGARPFLGAGTKPFVGRESNLAEATLRLSPSNVRADDETTALRDVPMDAFRRASASGEYLDDSWLLIRGTLFQKIAPELTLETGLALLARGVRRGGMKGGGTKVVRETGRNLGLGREVKSRKELKCSPTPIP